MHFSNSGPLSRFARSFILPAAMALVAATASAKAENAARPAGIIGTWVVKAVDAPFTHHMFVFNADGTMQQANPDFGNPDNSDSDGKGIWAEKDGRVIGKFVEVTADRKTHKFVSRGEISYEIDLAGDAFTGTAAARFYDANDRLLRGPLPTPLEGKRVTLP